eukprot:7902150-Pyramimonas_sp.AAC.1
MNKCEGLKAWIAALVSSESDTRLRLKRVSRLVAGRSKQSSKDFGLSDRGKELSCCIDGHRDL